jgi:bacteriocin biosynthesis cyclodehydratase domain-containing protein
MSLLRPGLHVVRRDDRHLQIGLDPPWRLVVPDEPDVQGVLDDLVSGRPPAPTTPAGHRVLHDLGRADMLLPHPAPLRPRAVAVAGDTRPAAEAERVLRAAGAVPAPVDRADLTVVVTSGEPDRDVVDDHLRADRPHLLVGAGPRGFRVGPFVVPGSTACLRCVDAHLAERDPRRGVVVEQLAGRTAAPDDPVLEALAVTWAVRDALRYLAGGTPSTWSATVDLDVELDPRRHSWSRHPHCGCAWDALATSQAAG